MNSTNAIRLFHAVRALDEFRAYMDSKYGPYGVHTDDRTRGTPTERSWMSLLSRRRAECTAACTGDEVSAVLAAAWGSRAAG